MKKVCWLYPAVAAVMLMSFVNPSRAVDASAKVSILRSPFDTQQTLDSDIRLRSMGFLTLPVQDESNLVGIFKYGGLAAGLSQDYRGVRKAELGYWMESGELKDKTAGTKRYDSDFDAFGGMGAFHFGGEGSEGAVAAGFSVENGSLKYPASAKDEPENTNFQAGYGHRLGNIILGFGYLSRDTDTSSIGSTTNNLTVTNIDLSVGYVFNPSEGQELAVVVGPQIATFEEKDDSSGNVEDTELDGIGAKAGLQYNAGEAFRAGLFVTSVKTEGDFVENGVRQADEDRTVDEIKFRAHYRNPGSAISFGGLIETSKTDRESSNEIITPYTNTSKGTTFGLGVAFHTAEDRGLIGLEGRLLSDERERTGSTPYDHKDNVYQLSLGGEYNVMPALALRGGLRTIQGTTELGGSDPDQDFSQLDITLGIGYRMNDRINFALSYINTMIESDAVASASLNKEEYGADSFQILGQLRFGGEAPTPS